MNILLTVPHDTLLSPQGHRERLDGLLALLNHPTVKLHILVPRSTPAADRSFRDDIAVHEFDEPKLFSRRIPFFLDWSRSFRAAALHCIRSHQLDMIIADFPWGAAMLANESHLPLILFSHGVEADFAPIVLRSFNVDIPIVRGLFGAVIGSIERRACRASRLILTMSEHDRRKLTERYQLEGSKAVYLPQPLEPKSRGEQVEARRALGIPVESFVVIFHGSHAHLPNREALEMIRSQIAPNLHAEDIDVLCVVAGAGMPIEQSPGYRNLGYLDALEPFFSIADLALVPILSGAGVRMKILDYFQAGVPVLTTQKGIEGIDIQFGHDALVTEPTPQSLTEAILHLKSNPTRLPQLAANARHYLQEHHNPQTIQTKLLTILKAR